MFARLNDRHRQDLFLGGYSFRSCQSYNMQEMRAMVKGQLTPLLRWSHRLSATGATKTKPATRMAPKAA